MTSVKIDLKDKTEYDYDDWLEFFRKKPADTLQDYVDELSGSLPADGYAALKRWMDIIENPSKMDKLHKGRLDKEDEGDIMELAVGDDDEAFYKGLIRQNTAQLNSSSVSPQEVARLSQNINIFRKALKEIRSRKPKEGTVLADVFKEIAKPKKKPVKRTAKKPTKKKVAKDVKPKSTRKTNAKN